MIRFQKNRGGSLANISQDISGRERNSRIEFSDKIESYKEGKTRAGKLIPVKWSSKSTCSISEMKFPIRGTCFRHLLVTQQKRKEKINFSSLQKIKKMTARRTFQFPFPKSDLPMYLIIIKQN